jgi:uncharacterized protein (DUF433 family)
MVRKPLSLVTSEQSAIQNIRGFEKEARKDERLRARMPLAHSWYAVQGEGGEWLFAHSKYAGYENNNATRYLEAATPWGGISGGPTERALAQWFVEVDPDTSLGKEIHQALGNFLAKMRSRPRKGARICVLRSELDRHPAAGGARSEAFLARISTDPRICGGRPCIKGTRMRVSDLLQMMADGATQAEISEDFPYITAEDIAAALAFAAKASDHRVIRAA